MAHELRPPAVDWLAGFHEAYDEQDSPFRYETALTMGPRRLPDGGQETKRSHCDRIGHQTDA